MIEYSKTRADNKNRAKEMTWLKGRGFVFVAAGVLLLMIFFFLVGILGNYSEAIQLGISCATLFAVLFVIYCNLYNRFQKAVTRNFETYELDGRIDFTIEKLDAETLELIRLTDEESFQIKKSDVKSVRKLKTIHIIILKNGRLIDLPRQADIDELLDTF